MSSAHSNDAIRRHHALQDGFPIGITDRTPKLIQDQLDRLGWRGPVGLSCDDTKLLPSLRPHLESDGKYYIVGGVGPPMLITNPDAIIHAIRLGELHKATKVRYLAALYLLFSELIFLLFS